MSSGQPFQFYSLSLNYTARKINPSGRKMADINVGEVNVAGGRYEVILRPVAVAAPAGVAPANPVNNGVANPQGGGKKKATRKLSGYMKFAQEERPKLLKENPSLRSDIPGIGRALGAKWRALSDEEKARY